MCGVDKLHTNSGSIVMMVNSSPSLNDIETATGKYVASMNIQFLEKYQTNNIKIRGKS
jgi:glutathione synthase/RimK-type ligase-like ATP-grasp enzyme